MTLQVVHEEITFSYQQCCFMLKEDLEVCAIMHVPITGHNLPSKEV